MQGTAQVSVLPQCGEADLGAKLAQAMQYQFDQPNVKKVTDCAQLQAARPVSSL
jgi:hypothetical protein